MMERGKGARKNTATLNREEYISSERRSKGRMSGAMAKDNFSL
jgi:hypothetical protein